MIYSSLVYALGRVPARTLKHIHETGARESIVRAMLEHAALSGMRMMRVTPYVFHPHFNPPGPAQRWNPGFRADALEGRNRFEEG